MKDLSCKKVLDFIDEFDFKKIPEPIALHLQSCEKCKKYLEFSMLLRKRLVVEKVDVKNELFFQIRNKSIGMKWRYFVLSFVLVFAVMIGFIIYNPFKNQDIISNSYTSSISSSAQEEVDSIDYFFTIALEI